MRRCIRHHVCVLSCRITMSVHLQIQALVGWVRSQGIQFSVSPGQTRPTMVVWQSPSRGGLPAIRGLCANTLRWAYCGSALVCQIAGHCMSQHVTCPQGGQPTTKTPHIQLTHISMHFEQIFQSSLTWGGFSYVVISTLEWGRGLMCWAWNGEHCRRVDYLPHQ